MKVNEVAISYLSQREVPNNMGFKDNAFEKKMIDVGFVKSYAWCALFMELCVKEGAPEFYKANEKLFSASATTTYKNFEIAKKVSAIPQVGCGVIWRHGSGWQGHAGIVIKVNADGTFETVEGNTNSSGGREGIEVAKKVRKVKQPYQSNGLNLVGFLIFN